MSSPRSEPPDAARRSQPKVADRSAVRRRTAERSTTLWLPCHTRSAPIMGSNGLPKGFALGIARLWTAVLQHRLRSQTPSGAA